MLGTNVPIEERERPAHDGDLIADISKARRELGYEPRVALEQGVREYADWLKMHG